MKYLSFLIKPASSLCNLECSYCFYQDVSKNRETESFGIMSGETARKLIDRAFDTVCDDGVLTFAFQGGEPTLAGIPFYREFTGYVEKKRKNQIINYSLQTNGTLIDDEWAELFYRHHFLVGVSLDGYESNTNCFRKTKEGTGAYKEIMRGIEVLRKHRVEFNILAVITKKLSHHPKAFYRFLQQQDFDYVQCIPCLGELQGETEEQLGPKEYAIFYKGLYREWLEEIKSGRYRSITLFDNLWLMLHDRPPQQCGMLGFCSPQFVTEADGSVYPCDFYVTDEYNCGNIRENSLEEIMQDSGMEKFLKEKKPSYKICRDCPFAGICHGGCKRQNKAFLSENGCAHREFLEYAYPTLSRIVLGDG